MTANPSPAPEVLALVEKARTFIAEWVLYFHNKPAFASKGRVPMGVSAKQRRTARDLQAALAAWSKANGNI